MSSLITHFNIVIIIFTALVSYYALNNITFFEKAAFRPYYIRERKEWMRWILHGFIHVDYMHLFVNMLTLYFFGDALMVYFTQLFGDNSIFFYLFFYLSAIVVSSIYGYYRHRNDFSYSAVGASGAVAAVLFSAILFSPFTKVCLYGAICIPGWLFALLYLYYEYVMGKRKQDNIGHDAHISGAIYGILFTLLIYPEAVMAFVDYFKK